MNQRKHRPKWLLVVTIMLAILMVVIVLLLRWNPFLPTVAIPTPKIPSPNAYDYYASAGKAVVDVNKISYAITNTPGKPKITIPPGASIEDNGKKVPLTSNSPDDRVYTLAEKDALIKKNAMALGTLRQGFAYKYWEPTVTVSNAGAAFNNYGNFRVLSRLLVLESQTRAGHGDYAGAMDSCLDAIRMSADLPRTREQIGVLIGRAAQAIGRNAAWELVDDLNAEEAKKAQHRLEDIINHQLPLWEILEEQKWANVAYLQKLLKKPGWRLLHSRFQDDKVEWLFWKTQLVGVSERGILRDYQAYMDNYITSAHLTYVDICAAEEAAAMDPLIKEFANSTRFFGYYWTQLETQNSLLLVTLALRAYKEEQGRYPNSLAELVPAYLKKLPEDPFAAKGTFGYKKTKDKYVLYSIGPDGKEDGGKPIEASVLGTQWESRTDIRYRVSYDSKGDIVAGINMEW